jgi:penicillin-binding protein 1B
MKRAVILPAYKRTEEFEPPAGVVEEGIDPQTGLVATTSCPQAVQEYFVSGSEPTQYCDLHGGLAKAPPVSWMAHLFGKPENPPPPVTSNSPNNASNTAGKPRPNSAPGSTAQQDDKAQQPEKKKGLLDRVFGIFGGSKKPADSSKPQP